MNDPRDPSLVTVREVLHGWKLQKITTLEGDFATYRYDGKGDLNPLKPPTVCDRIYTKHIGGVDDKDKYDYVVSETFLVKRSEDHRVPCVRVHAVLGDDKNAFPEKDERETVEGEVSLAENGQRFFPEDDEHGAERETVEGEVSFDLAEDGQRYFSEDDDHNEGETREDEDDLAEEVQRFPGRWRSSISGALGKLKNRISPKRRRRLKLPTKDERRKRILIVFS